LKKKSFEASRSSTSSPIPDGLPAVTKKVVGGSGDQASSSSISNSPPVRPGWGWGSVWSSTAAALQQARTVVDDQVKTLSTNEQARKLQEGVFGYVKSAQLDKLGWSSAPRMRGNPSSLRFLSPGREGFER
jgi:hypothetical protein